MKKFIVFLLMLVAISLVLLQSVNASNLNIKRTIPLPKSNVIPQVQNTIVVFVGEFKYEDNAAYISDRINKMIMNYENKGRKFESIFCIVKWNSCKNTCVPLSSQVFIIFTIDEDK